MVSFEQHIVFPPATQDRVDNLIRLMRSLVLIGILLVVLTIFLAVLGLGIGCLVWRKENSGKGRVTCQCGGQEIRKAK
ncbi:hypothetical protein GMOD_00007303 [Pyrenophora seminiperda CCB06]|uniref:Uncharacterized protein n=1 Tax=Pyrenophora seminiperda CCB06 TaxID=1302712 RepID=A0A3M7MCS7_9PLEO|nr:hypothetical protein GMOD_00007303 [Pyrenophora seminiperda CCB06]